MVRRQKLIIKDERGVPNYMAAFSWTGSKDPAQAPPMFVVCGEVVDAVLISQFSGGDGVAITTGQVKEDWDGAHMRDIQLDGLESIPQIIFDLAILPPDYKERKDGIYVDSELEEAVPFRGASFCSTSNAGASAIRLDSSRSYVGVLIGFRSALYVKDWKQITGKLIGA